LKPKKTILNAFEMKLMLDRLALEIVEKNIGTDKLYLIGIKSRGVPMAERFAEYYRRIFKVEVPVGIIDISLYRDDLSKVAENPVHNGTNLNFDITGKNIILTDDVLYSGKTVQTALNVLKKLGEPDKIMLCVLIDRGHKTLPIFAEFTGKTVDTASDEVIKVAFAETDGSDFVKIME
jgi:pyrimidine operon attenuation protein / uracil phosphoribosyltransferase